MVEIVGVRFKRVSKIYYSDPKGLTLAEGTRVIVETSRGVEIGTVVLANRMVDEKDCYLPLSPVLRVAPPEDLAKDAKNREKEKSALKICEEKIAKRFRAFSEMPSVPRTSKICFRRFLSRG